MTKKGPPASNEQRVAVDLNNPVFLKSWFSLEDKNESARILNTLEKVGQLTWTQVYRDAGLKWERITHPPVTPPAGIDAVYSIRVTQARRAVVFRERNLMRFLLIAEDHDATYPKGKRK